jgi:serine/threonine protein kinase
MGVVYRALDPKIGRTLAIKSIRLNELTDVEERGRMRERLFREAQSAGILSHPNIVTIYDVSEEEGMAYIFMEFVNGMAMDDLLRASPAPTGALVMDLLTQTAAALDYAHKNGIIHRDIKPANIMVHEGRTAKVCDFGVAKIVSQQMTQAGLLMGTPSYMSPEQIEGRPMDGRSDQFALAVMVFDILTKEKPFVGESLPILLYKICRADPPSASGLNTTLGIWVDPVLRKALAKNPDERYPSCSAFIAELRRALEERPGWMLPGKGFPGDETTTGSGHHESEAVTSGAIPVATSGSSQSMTMGPTKSTPSHGAASPFAPHSSNPSLTRSTANPSLPAPPPPPPAFSNQPAFAQTSTATVSTDAIPLPRSRVEQKRTSPLVYVIPILALLAGGGFFAYQKFFEPKPAVDNQVDPSKPLETKPDEPIPGKPKPDVPTAPIAQIPKPGNPPENPQTPPRDPKPASGAGPFEVRFIGSPAGVSVAVDGDPSIACKSPCEIPLSKGRHTFTAALDGYRSMQRSFEVTGESSVPIDLVETVGILVVRSTPPGAIVQLNGQERPEKTPAELHIKPGTYQVVIISPDGRRDASTVTVKDGIPGSLNVNFP